MDPMYKLMARWSAFVHTERVARDEKGATAVEYGLMVGLIAAVIVTIVSTLGEQIEQKFDDIVTGLT